MMQFKIEQFLPCKLPEVITKTKRKALPNYDFPLYIKEELFVYPMNKGFYIEGGCGKFYLDSIELLRSINGKSANEICNSENDFAEIEQYYHYSIIGYEDTSVGKIIFYDVNRRYFELYNGIETTRFCYIPLKIEIDLTRKCNLNCKHCAKDASPSQVDGKLLFQDYINLIENAGKIGVPRLILMGGEPTCYPEFIELAGIAKSAGIRTLSTSTNGWLIDEELAKKMAALFSPIQVSLHGANSETHDRITGRAGAFSKAYNAIKLLRENNANLLCISFTVMKENVQEMSQMVKLAKELDVNYIRFLALYPQGRGRFLNQWNDEEQKEIAKTIDTLRDNNVNIVGVEAGGFPPYRDISTDATFYGCPGGRISFYINPDGNVKPCSTVNMTIDRIQESDIIDLWHSESMVELRKKLACKCSYNMICAGGCLVNKYWRKMFLGKGKNGISSIRVCLKNPFNVLKNLIYGK